MEKKGRLELHLSSSEGRIPLAKSIFYHPLAEQEITCIRSTKCFAGVEGLWPCKSVSAVVYAFLLAKHTSLLGRQPKIILDDTNSYTYRIWDSFRRNRDWVFALCGTDAEGSPLLKKILQGSNLQRTKDGAVIIYNSRMLSPESISVIFDGVVITDADSLEKIITWVKARFLQDASERPLVKRENVLSLPEAA